MLISSSIAKLGSRAPRLRHKVCWLSLAIAAGSLVLLLFVPGRALGQAKIPDTPAGKTLQALLDALNSGDRAKMEDYVHRFDPSLPVEQMRTVYDDTGGFDLIAIDASDPLLLVFRVKEKKSDSAWIGTLQLKDAQTGTVESVGLHPAPAEAVIESIQLDAAYRQRIIEGISKSLKELYVYPEIGQKMVDALSDHLKRGDYDAITNGDVLAFHLTQDLLDVSHDKHLHVHFSATKLGPMNRTPTQEDKARIRKHLESENCGFQKLEILPHNIGYLKLSMFAYVDLCGPTAAAAMNFLAHVNAIIFDVRENSGGDPKMVQFIDSYLFDTLTHLDDLYDRNEDATTQYWTLPYLPGDRMPDTPVFVLTSSEDVSAPEAFAYELKNLKRATIVGETTGGGAHTADPVRLDDHFSMGVPEGRMINPVTKTDWEGVGVEPDVKVKAADALEEAERLAISKLPAD